MARTNVGGAVLICGEDLCCATLCCVVIRCGALLCGALRCGAVRWRISVQGDAVSRDIYPDTGCLEVLSNRQSIPL